MKYPHRKCKFPKCKHMRPNGLPFCKVHRKQIDSWIKGGLQNWFHIRITDTTVEDVGHFRITDTTVEDVGHFRNWVMGDWTLKGSDNALVGLHNKSGPVHCWTAD